MTGNMSTSLKKIQFAPVFLLGAVLVVSAVTLLGGCVAQVRATPPPPPPRVYVPPPPPAYVAPAVEAGVQVNEAPPPLPDYEQPPAPEEGYLWTPGYWAYAGGGYYWVPGTWVQPPRVGVLWTPGYWGFVGGAYAFHAGYWGPHIGFYGGVNYGFGYVGVGFLGGRWIGNSFAYNRSVTNINVTNVHNTYNETVIKNVTVNKVSYNGGAGGVAAAPTSQERVAAQETHVPPTSLQRQHVQEAAKNPALFAKANGGHPSIAATPKPAAFNAPGVVGARGAVTPPVRTVNAAQHNHTGKPSTSGQPQAAHKPAPNASAHPQAVTGKPNAARPKTPKPNPKAQPEKKTHEPQGDNK
jgi:WXXGXW repeat (2 copies)